ncbi:MAG: IMPACT family protein [Saprospiraceae bacterium]
MEDTYKMVQAKAYGFFKDRGSKFEAYAYPVYDEAQCHEKLSIVRKLHPKARHFCYAYRLGLGKINFRANDDGEPSGTAGRPILGQLDSFGLTNTIIIVVRYFGGTLLGASGLINAYRNGAMEALKAADIVEKMVEDIYRFTFEYALMSPVMNAIKKQSLEMVRQDFQAIGIVEVAIRQSEVEETLDLMRAQIANVHLEEVATLEKIDGLEIEFQYTR